MRLKGIAGTFGGKNKNELKVNFKWRAKRTRVTNVPLGLVENFPAGQQLSLDISEEKRGRIDFKDAKIRRLKS